LQILRGLRVTTLRAGLFICVALFSALPLMAQEPARTRAPTVTRLVKLFLDKESALGQAVRSGNAPALGAMLAEDFEVRAGPRAARPVPRAEWMDEILRKRDPGGEPNGMAVHELNGTAVVSFTQGHAGGALFIVDVWRGQGDEWKLAIRYASPAGSPSFTIPGVGPGEPEIPKKY
jgi:hypothetical protein